MTAGGRTLTLCGTHPHYLRQFAGYNADAGAIGSVLPDLPHASVIFDVGANIGVTALAMAARRPDCRVVAFEPIPSSSQCLRNNVRRNDIGNVKVIEAAVSDEPGEVAMTDLGPWSSVVHGSMATMRRRTPLDDYASPGISLVKIDVEGHEPNVLVGARRILAEQRPLVFLEFNTWTLLLQHYDPLVFADALYSCFDVLRVYEQDKLLTTPLNGTAFVHDNMQYHHCVNDVLLRPRSPILSLRAMTAIYDPPNEARQ